jgi:SAM-dependent methyltransferase
MTEERGKLVSEGKLAGHGKQGKQGKLASEGKLAGQGELAGHPDQVRWDARYTGSAPSFRPHPLAELALTRDLPAGPVADLACGPSGSALLAAARGRQVTAVDVSGVALELLGQEARRRGLADRITLVHADLAGWRPDPAGYALVLCTGFWDPAVFAVAAGAATPGGALGWEAFTVAARQARPTINPAWCLGPGEPATLLPDGFTVLAQHDLPDSEHGDRRRLLARRRP